MISDQELMVLLDKIAGEYKGQSDDLISSFGMIILGRLYGWRVARLVTSSKDWTKATRLFGDPKLLMPERGKYAHKSLGLAIADKLGGYWNLIRSSGTIALEEKRKML